MRLIPFCGRIRYTSEPWQFGHTTPLRPAEALKVLVGICLGAELVGEGNQGRFHTLSIAPGCNSPASLTRAYADSMRKRSDGMGLLHRVNGDL